MLSSLRWPLVSVIAAISIELLAQKPVQQPQSSSVPSALFSSLHWRSIGPYRGGRTRGVAGVPSQPNVFYIGVCNGGI